MDKTILPRGVAVSSDKKNNSSYKSSTNQKKQSIDKKFEMDSNEFPSLTDILTQSGSSSRHSINSNKTTLSYSDKLKACRAESVSSSFRSVKEKRDGLRSKNCTEKFRCHFPERTPNVTSENMKSDTEILVKPTSSSKHTENSIKVSAAKANAISPNVIINKKCSEDASNWTTVGKTPRNNPLHGGSNKSFDPENADQANRKTKSFPRGIPKTTGCATPDNNKQKQCALNNTNVVRRNAEKSPQLLKDQNPVQPFSDRSSKSKPADHPQELPKTKKKRKSKVKRQAALQSGKLLILTRETHLKILGRDDPAAPCHFMPAPIDINDSEEYPELGFAATLKVKKEGAVKAKDDSKGGDVVEDDVLDTNKNDKSLPISEEGVLQVEDVKISTDPEILQNKEEISSGAKKHVGNPITMSLFDMIQTAKTKKKRLESKVETSEENKHPPKPLIKKVIASAPVNPLDSSRPTVKRGKEREKPKVKKPSRMKKLILMGRQMKKECVKSENCENESDAEKELLNYKTNELDRLEEIISDIASLGDEKPEQTNRDSQNEKFPLELSCENYKSGSFPNMEENSANLEIDDFTVCLKGLFENSNFQGAYLNTIEVNNEKSTKDDTFQAESRKSISCLANTENNATSEDFVLKQEYLLETRSESSVSESCMHSNETSQSITDINHAVTEEDVKNTFSYEEKVKAAKLIIHTRKFRRYCNHFISKEIDDVVHSLIDDLARFQDRQHQKDPVKARIRRRLVYGIKEIMRHIKLKKIKCIIIATDIEDIKTEGGLNDALEEIKSLAEIYCVPCVFSHQRVALGKVCRKSVPVSCVGVFNYEGSEKNFKQMIELREDSKHDYSELLKKLTFDLLDDQVEEVFSAETQNANAVRTASQDILRALYFNLGTNHTTPNTEAKNLDGISEKNDLKNLNDQSELSKMNSPNNNSDLFSNKTSDGSSITEENKRNVDCLSSEDIPKNKSICDILCNYKVVRL